MACAKHPTAGSTSAGACTGCVDDVNTVASPSNRDGLQAVLEVGANIRDEQRTAEQPPGQPAT